MEVEQDHMVMSGRYGGQEGDGCHDLAKRLSHYLIFLFFFFSFSFEYCFSFSFLFF